MRKEPLPALSAIYIGSLFLAAALLPAQQKCLPPSQLVEESVADATRPAPAEVSTAIDLSSTKPAPRRAVQLQPILEALTNTLDEYRKSGNRREQANTLSGIANTYLQLNERQRSLDFYDSALAVWKEIDDKEGQVNALSNMGDVYLEWGFPDRAAHYYRESLALYAEMPNRPGKAATLNGLGMAYLSLRDKKKALGYLNNALLTDRDIHDPLAEARTLSNLGATYFLLGKDREKALGTLQDALTRLEVLGDYPDEANTLEIIGIVWRSMKKPEIASSNFQRALLLFRNAGDTQGEESVRKQLRSLDESVQ
jgi:tetratricopeptide (TPR) repeat protein